MKLRGISPMQPVCEVCDKVLGQEEAGRVFQNNFFHEDCFQRLQEINQQANHGNDGLQSHPSSRAQDEADFPLRDLASYPPPKGPSPVSRQTQT